MSSKKYSNNKRIVRHLRLRKKISGTSFAPRLAVFRSNRKIYAQVINDDRNKTLISSSSLEINSSLFKRMQMETKYGRRQKIPLVTRYSMHYVSLPLRSTWLQDSVIAGEVI